MADTKTLVERLRTLWEKAQTQVANNFFEGILTLTALDITAQNLPSSVVQATEQSRKEAYRTGSEKGWQFAEQLVHLGEYDIARDIFSYAARCSFIAGHSNPSYAPELLKKIGMLGFEGELEKARQALYCEDITAVPLWEMHLEKAAFYAEKAFIDYRKKVKELIKIEYPQLSEKLIEFAELAIDKNEPADAIIDRIYYYANYVGAPVPEKVTELQKKAKYHEGLERIN